MELTRNEKGAIALLIPTLILFAYDVTGMYSHMKWGMALPHALRTSMPFMVNVILPIVFAAGGFAIFLAWERRRPGFVIILILAIGNIVLNAPVTYWRWVAGFHEGAVICGVEGVIGAFTIYYTSKAIVGLRSVAAASIKSRYVDAEAQ